MKNLDYFSRIQAEKIGMDIATVKAVNMFFWKEGIKANLGSLKHRSLFIKNIGTFTISRYKLYQKITFYIEKIRGLRASKKYTNERKDLYISIYNEHIRKLLKQRNEIAKEFYNN